MGQSEKFIREFFVDLRFNGHDTTVTYDTAHPEAKVTHVAISKEYNDHGRLSKELLVLLVRDAGPIRSKPEFTKQVVVVRRLNDLTPIPETCGKLIGFVQPSADHFAYYVFDSTVPPQRARSSSEETTSPARAVADKIEPSCSCVVEGPTVHETGKESASGRFPVADSDDWFSPPSVAKAS